MTKEFNQKILAELVDEGYAVVVFEPSELEGASPSRVEDRLIELGWDVINDLKPEEFDDEE